MLLSTVLALSSAVLFAVTTNLQRVVASSVPADRGPLHLLRRVVTDRRWLAGSLVGGVSLGLHAVALARGSIIVVQAVMATGLVATLAIEAVRERRMLRATELGGACLVVVGVAVVVAISRPPDAGTSSTWTLPICLGVIVAAAAAVITSRQGVTGTSPARWLAAAAGACFAVDAVFLQRLTGSFRLLWAQPPWAEPVAPGLLAALMIDLAGFFGASIVGGIAVHRAYQVAHLRSVQPPMAAAEPLTAFIIGALVLRDGVHGGSLGYVVVTAGIVTIVAGILTGLSGREAVPRRVLEPGVPDRQLVPVA